MYLIVVEPILLDLQINLDDLPQKIEDHCLIYFIAKALFPVQIQRFGKINNEYTKDCLANVS